MSVWLSAFCMAGTVLSGRGRHGSWELVGGAPEVLGDAVPQEVRDRTTAVVAPATSARRHHCSAEPRTKGSALVGRRVVVQGAAAGRQAAAGRYAAEGLPLNADQILVDAHHYSA